MRRSVLSRWWRRVDVWFSLFVLGATVATRLPFRAQMLYNWDAVQFALALREFDVTKHQPHPPGYVLYVALGKLLNSLVHDPNQSYVALGIICSALTTTVVYFLGTALYGRLTGAVAALLLMVSPLFWFYGGFRPTALALLLPLWCLGVVWARPKLWRVGLAGVVLGLSTLSWFLPLVWLSGGWARYFAVSWDLFASVVHPTSIFSGNLGPAVGQLRFLLESTLVGLGAVTFALLFSVWSLWRHGRLVPGRAELFLSEWI